MIKKKFIYVGLKKCQGHQKCKEVARLIIVRTTDIAKLNYGSKYEKKKKNVTNTAIEATDV